MKKQKNLKSTKKIKEVQGLFLFEKGLFGYEPINHYTAPTEPPQAKNTQTAQTSTQKPTESTTGQKEYVFANMFVEGA